MKVILNRDLSPLGEEGDVKEVAKGYARNFLFPRGIALPYNDKTKKLFEGRREEIEGRKNQKRFDASGLKEKLESISLDITMSAGPNGKLYGAVTSQTVVDVLAKQGFQIERKKIEIPGTHIKNVGKYKAVVKLYENAFAEVVINVIGQEIKTETAKAAPARPFKKRRDDSRESSTREGLPKEDLPSDTVPRDTVPRDAASASSQEAVGEDGSPSSAISS